MKKTVAVLAMSLPCACAFAQTSTVTIYGVIDAAVTYAKPGGDGGSLYKLDSGVGAGSRLGFRGIEDLGSGLKANFTAEMGFDASSGVFQQGGIPWGRQIWVGLSGQAWTLTAGRQYGPNEIAITATEAFAQNYWGSSAGWGIGTLQSPLSGAGSGCQGATVRINNSVQGTYTAYGVTGKMMVGAGDESRGTGRFYNPNLTYAAGPLTLTAGYARIRQCAADISASATPDWQTEIVAGGAYDFGPAKLFAGYYNYNPSEANKVVTPATYTNHKVYWVGTRVPVFGVGTIIAQVARLVNNYPVQADGKGTSFGLTYEHGLSKRTRLYVSGGYIKNDNRARFGLAAATAAQAAFAFGADPKTLSLGIVHLF